MKSSVLFRHYLVYYYEYSTKGDNRFAIVLPEYEKHIMLNTYRDVVKFHEHNDIVISRVIRLTQEEVCFD